MKHLRDNARPLPARHLCAYYTARGDGRQCAAARPASIETGDRSGAAPEQSRCGYSRKAEQELLISSVGSPLLRGADRKYRTGSLAHHLLGHATQEEMRQPGAPVGRQHGQLGPHCLGSFENALGSTADPSEDLVANAPTQMLLRNLLEFLFGHLLCPPHVW